GVCRRCPQRAVLVGPHLFAQRGLIEAFGTAITRPTENISSRWSLAYSSCWAGFSFSTSCFTIPIHPIIIYMILSFVNLKRYLVNWNARRRLLGLRLLAPPKTFAGIARVLRPHSERSERGGSSHARGKRPPAVEINGFYNTYTNRSALHLGCK